MFFMVLFILCDLDSAVVQGVAVEVIPVEDEVEREADDESSELEENSWHYMNG